MKGSRQKKGSARTDPSTIKALVTISTVYISKPDNFALLMLRSITSLVATIARFSHRRPAYTPGVSRFAADEHGTSNVVLSPAYRKTFPDQQWPCMSIQPEPSAMVGGCLPDDDVLWLMIARER
jgi:hypothetical protein